jgi:hypothetical protein
MRASDYDQSRFLKAADIKVATKFKIKSVTEETVGQGADQKKALVVWFTTTEKALVINKTNNRALREAFGDETDGWVGKVIVLYQTIADFRGKMTPALRVRLPKPKAEGEAAAKPAPAPNPTPKPKPAVDPDLDDDLENLPFDKDDEEDF